ncbi:MAG: GNAT family N-acetyltransferase [Solirubrobacteraceae bacterium]
MRSRLVGLEALDDADRRGWAALAERAIEPNPYFHPDFVLPAARMLGDAVAIVVAGDWEAAVPVTAARRWRRLPLPGLLSWIHAQCFLGTPLVADAAAVEPLLAGLGSLGAGAFAEIDLAAASGPLADALAAALPASAIPFGRFERAALERRGEPTYLEGRLSGKHRRAQRRLGRDLAAELGGEVVLVDRGGSDAAVDTFLALESAGWKGESATALSSLPGGGDFLHAVCRAFAARGALQLLFLEAGDHVAAARLNLRAGAELFCFKIAHDEALRRFSPGMQMELHMLDHFHADATAARMDSCADPASKMFNRLWADRKALGGVLLPRGARGRAVRPALRAVAERIGRNRVPEAA